MRKNSITFIAVYFRFIFIPQARILFRISNEKQAKEIFKGPILKQL